MKKLTKKIKGNRKKKFNKKLIIALANKREYEYLKTKWDCKHIKQK